MAKAKAPKGGTPLGGAGPPVETLEGIEAVTVTEIFPDGAVGRNLPAVLEQKALEECPQNGDAPRDPAPPSVPLEDLANRINQEHAQAEAHFKMGLEHALEAGRLLLEAKSRLDHGDWLPWL